MKDIIYNIAMGKLFDFPLLRSKQLMIAVLVTMLFASFFISSCMINQTSSGQEDLYFREEFSGSALNSTLWNTEIANNGTRWCSTVTPGPSLLRAIGEWVDVSSQTCHDVTQSPPYGNIVVNNGLASFSSNSSYTFPYIWSGLSPISSPFPEIGDFVFEIRMKYDEITPYGSGVVLLERTDSNPIGDNPPFGPNDGAGIWADSRGLIIVWRDQEIPVPFDPNSFHTYALEYVNSTYFLYVDGTLVTQPKVSYTRPNTIWIGNPGIAYWEPGNFSDFTIDYIRIGEDRTGSAAAQLNASAS